MLLEIPDEAGLTERVIAAIDTESKIRHKQGLRMAATTHNNGVFI